MDCYESSEQLLADGADWLSILSKVFDFWLLASALMLMYFELDRRRYGFLILGENDVILLRSLLIVKLALNGDAGEFSPSLLLSYQIGELPSPYKRWKSILFLEYLLQMLNASLVFIALLEPSSFLNLSMRIYN